MNITKRGDPAKSHREFRFVCKNCRCEWNANRGDKGLKFSPPCMEFFVYMNCPNCGEEAITE